MPNVLHNTEDFSISAYWIPGGSPIIVPNVYPAPAFAGLVAGRVDTIEDASDGGDGDNIYSDYETIPNDSNPVIGSIFVRKDGVTSRFPQFGMNLAGGTGVDASVMFNTSTGAITDSIYGTPNASGVIDFDALFWRVWFKAINNSSGNTVARFFVYPAFGSVFGSPDSFATGVIGIWGANIVPGASVVGPYDPNPSYPYKAATNAAAALLPIILAD